MQDRIVMDTFKDYVGIKAHFNEADFIYKPNHFRFSRYTVNTIKKRNDRAMFIKLAEKFEVDPDGRREFLISQFKDNKNAWVGDFFSERAKSIHNQRMKIMQSFQSHLDKDIESIVNYYNKTKTIKDILVVNYDRPLLYKDLKLNDETFSLIDHVFTIENDSINPLWYEKFFMYRKYKHFLPLHNSSVLNAVSALKDRLAISSEADSVTQENTLEHLFF